MPLRPDWEPPRPFPVTYPAGGQADADR